MNMIVILLINSIVSLAEFTLCGKIALYIIQAKVTSHEPDKNLIKEPTQ